MTRCASQIKRLEINLQIATKLVFAEGIMGSGKSSTVRFLCRHLADIGIDAAFIGEEVVPHPIRLDDVLPHPYQPWLDVSPEEYIERSHLNWERFVEQRDAEGSVMVLDGQLFHGDLTNLLMMDATYDQLKTHIGWLSDATRPLNPAVIYFTQQDVNQAIARIAEIRGDRWVEYQVNWKTVSPYCEARDMHGYEGWVQLYRDYRAICDTLFADLEMTKCNIDTTEGDWPSYEKAVCSFLGLPSKKA